MANGSTAPLDVVDFVADTEPSVFLKCSMSRRVAEKLVAEERLRPFLSQQLQIQGGDDEDQSDCIKRIAYGSGARRVVLIELDTIEHAQLLLEKLHNQPCELITQRTLYVEFVLPRHVKEDRDNFRRVAGVARIHAIQDPAARVPGLIVISEFITREQEQELMQLLDQQDGARWMNTVKARQVQHFGFEFNYNTRRCDTDQPLHEPMPAPMAQLTSKIEQAAVMDTPDQITVNDYQPGQGIAAHIDTHSAFTDAIASLSLVSEVVMEFRHPDGRLEGFLLPPRSLLVMTGASRYEWTHAIPPRLFDVIDGKRVDRQRRVSITFRKVQDTPCTCDFPVQCDVADRTASESAALASKQQAPETTLHPTHVEQQYVHAFYETVASHFSSTRYNPWPRVAEFVRSLEPGSLIADIGCGNGKYMKCVDAASQSAIIGGDRSSNLASICKQSGLNVMVCDAMVVPIRSSSCDAALSIAVLHHLSTLHHRLTAVKELIRVLRVGGRGVIYAWAHEQLQNSRRRFEGEKQDFMVPWNLDRRFAAKTEQAAPTAAGAGAESSEADSKAPIVVQRYCHMFKEGELEQLVEMAGNAVVLDHYYDESNWAVVLQRVS